MALTVEDRLAIQDLMALHGHLMDSGDLDRLNELFAADVVYDVSAFGLGELRGIEAIKQAALTLGDDNPLGHHVTNVVITAVDENSARVMSKGIGIRPDGSGGTVVYSDIVRLETGGWRIVHRTVIPRKRPLRP